MRKQAGKNALEYFVLTLEDVVITSVSAGGSGADSVTESLTLNFARYRLKYQAQKNDGSAAGGPVEAGWDIEQNKTY
jgi:type VI secretion system secreted protein Hcp